MQINNRKLIQNEHEKHICLDCNKIFPIHTHICPYCNSDKYANTFIYPEII